MVGPSLAPTPTPQIVSEHKFHKFRSWRDAGNENVTKDEVEIEHLSVTSSTIEARHALSNHIYCCTEEGDTKPIRLARTALLAAFAPH